MEEIAVRGRTLEEVELEGDSQEFLSFLSKHVKKVLEGIEGLLEVSYGGEPGLLVIGRISNVRYEILVVASRKPAYRVTVSGYAAEGEASRLAHIVERLIHSYFIGGDKGSVYFVLVPGLSLMPAKAESALIRVFQKMFLGNMVFIFAFSILLSYIVYAFLGPLLTPIALVLLQIPLVLLSPWIVASVMGDWRLDEQRGTVYIVGVKLPIEVYQDLLPRLFVPKRYEIKRRLYRAVACGLASEEYVKALLAEYGLSPNAYELEIKRIDLYKLVRDVAARFGLRMPRVYLSNIIIPNAAATGVYPLSSAVFVTTGLLVRLGEDEVKAVIGHELSHLKRRDILVLFLLGACEYLTRVYVLLFLFPQMPFLLAMLYLYASLTAFFLAAKIVEARADIEAAAKLGLAATLASALRKIGFTKIAIERTPGGRLAAWFAWRQHPPTVFRVESLEALAGREHEIKSPWALAVRLCLRDIAATIAKGW